MSDSNNPFPKRLPEFSRAVDDSEDSDWEEAVGDGAPSASLSAGGVSNCALRLGPEARQEMSSGGGRLDCSTLLVGVGPAACGFLRACVLGDEAKIMGLVCCGFPEGGLANSLGQTALGDFACFLYRLECNPQVLVCQSMSPVSPADCHAFTESLLSLLDLDNLDVAVLTTESLTSYQSEFPTSELPSPLIRCLRSSAMVGQGGGKKKGESATASAPPIPQLEAPNLITGVAAELLSVCQMRRIPAVAFVSYLASRDGPPCSPDAVAAFKPALHAEPLRFCRPGWPRDADLVIDRLCRQQPLDSALAAASSLYT